MPQLKRAVTLLSLNAAGQILCISRRNQPDQFGLIAGKVDPGEHDIQAIIREAEEEAGLRLSPYELVPLYVAAVPASVAGVAYWTTTYLLTRHLDPDEHLVAEEGLTLAFKTIPAFLDAKGSPFTDYNSGVLTALNEYLVDFEGGVS